MSLSSVEATKLESLLVQEKKVDAEEYIKILLSKYPTNIELFQTLGIISAELSHHTDALFAFKKVVELNPENADGYNNLGNIFKSLGQLNNALKNFKKAILLNPNHIQALYNLGNHYFDKEQFKQAIKYYKKVDNIQPNIAEVHNNIGAAYKHLDKIEESFQATLKALSINPSNIASLLNLGGLYLKNNQNVEAEKVFKETLTIDPNSLEAHRYLTNSLISQSKFNEAEEVCKKIISIWPDDKIVNNKLALIYDKKGDTQKAIDLFSQGILKNPDDYSNHHNLGNIYQRIGDLGKAIQAYDNSLKLNPKNFDALAEKFFLHAKICDWVFLRNNRNLIKKLGLDRQNVIQPFLFLALEDEPSRQLKRAKNFSSSISTNQESIKINKPKRKPKRLNLGYFSPDFRKHPVGCLMSKVIDYHDRSKFKVIGYNFGQHKDDSLFDRFKKSFDIFRDLRNLNETEILEIIRNDNIDIAIDLAGYTTFNLANIFSYKFSPIQINFLGYPGSLGASYINYIIADKNLIPESHRDFYSEKVIYLPNQYQPQDDELFLPVQIPSKESLGLPENSFIFCSFCNSYKITETEFSIWLELLHDVKDSVLWLYESNNLAKSNLIHEAELKGISSKRLIFTKAVSYENYLANLKIADLFLDTFIYNAGATASDALRSGLPIITKPGVGYTSRMASSLLKSLEMDELITSSKEEYKKLAFTLATNKDKLESIKIKLNENLLSKPLFKTKQYTQDLEKGFIEAYDRFFNEEPINHIFIK